MNIEKLSKEELEQMSHLDLAYNYIKYKKERYSTIELLKSICKLLEYDDNAFENLIGDFYTSLNLDKRFILIENKWDLTENHSVKMVVEDEIDDDIESYENIDDESEENIEIEDEAVLEDAEALEDVDDDLDDDMDELNIISEEELEEEESD